MYIRCAIFNEKLLSCALILYVQKVEKNSQWIVDYALKKRTEDIWNHFFCLLALLIHTNANILRHSLKSELFL